MIRLRRATPRDAAALGAVHVAAWRETYAGLLPDEMLASLSIDVRTAMWARALSDPATDDGTRVHVAEEDGRIVGFGACGRQRDEKLAALGFNGEINAIYILRAYQRAGLGRAIMRLMAQALLENDRGAATLWVLRENTGARAFYQRLAGAVVAEKEDKRPNAILIEVAYGWHDLSPLLRQG